MTKILEAKYICVGSPTLNNNLLPTVAQFLTYFKGLAPQNRIAIPFGSYGWGGQSISQIADIFTETGCKILTSFRVNYVPDNTYLNDVTQNVVNELTKLKNTEVT
jgi:flavorubredoxin